ncbi:MAG: type II toxin-antitoxin system RelE/ParE family toxin [Planctomycetota bacterium]
MRQVKIHRLVVDEDFKKVDHSDRSVILKATYKKLSIASEKYGSPLRGELKGYWKLKILHYRVVYRIEKDTVQVLVLKVSLRRDEAVYKEMLLRLRKL